MLTIINHIPLKQIMKYIKIDKVHRCMNGVQMDSRLRL